MTEILLMIVAFVGGWIGWTLAEYVLHRFAMHVLGGKGIMSREHLEHHVTSSWSFDPVILLAWAGIFLVGCAVWIPLTRLAGASWPVAASVAVGWGVGYFFYEFFHARAH
ncbi:MAG: hypothetical protein KA755_09135, partial [Candidatus Microthrix sp.]|nr:hypothetical protein [Candidatus Microthrix sp.]